MKSIFFVSILGLFFYLPNAFACPLCAERFEKGVFKSFVPLDDKGRPIYGKPKPGNDSKADQKNGKMPDDMKR